MNSVRINYNKFEEQSFLSFIKNIDKNKSFRFRAHNPADASVMQDRYTYTKNNKRVSIVYETKAQTLVITAPEAVISDVTALIPGQHDVVSQPPQKSGESQRVFVREQRKESTQKENLQKDNAPQLKPADKNKPQKVKHQEAQIKADTEQQNKQRKESTQKENLQKDNAPQLKSTDKNKIQKVKHQETQIKADTEQQNKQRKESTKKTKIKQVGVQSPSEKSDKMPAKQTEPKAANNTQTKQNKTSELKEKKIKQEKKTESQEKQTKQNKTPSNTFIIKKVAEDRFNELLKKIKANKSMRYKGMTSTDNSRVYTVSSPREKATVKYQSGDVYLMGTRGDLYSELQLMMSQASDYKTAIKSHIEFSGEEKRAQDIARELKKKLPDAFEFLSEQSKIDLAIGIIDINNSAVVLSDYSTLLIPCFRGLERLIFDLQHAQGIVVKMIGQAYEKEDGNHVLKYAYRRKIPSVIYAEVMAALYAEYYKHRNFYAHSDGGYDNLSRVITDKQQVQAIFNHIMTVINYNGKKLKEIGFRI